ncbi:zinc-dependent metalloprotease [Psychroserpens jangbogonensis]|uniref:zinc-dependent metalloprotease n=1 Tax=Psychroserpens jangbogonensis TaxID=1484460 RepID=UPI00053E759D|nr:zinc-dependent metalloprotease [Psychroserpens jangbogonensis]
MTFKSIAISLLFFLSFFFSFSQECGFDSEQNKRRQNPEYLRQLEQSEDKIQNFIESEDMFNRMGGVLTIPVVVHVLHLGEAVGAGTNISAAQIQSSIDNLNDFYRGLTPASPLDFEMEFTLAQRDPNCNATTGINRIDASGVTGYLTSGVSFQGAGADEDDLKDLSRWPETDYFNVWIVTEIDGNNGGGGFQGYANFFNGNAYEGSVMMHSVFGYDPTNANPSWPLNFARDNSTVSHEVGHYFHLYHTFQGDDADNNGISDQCPDDSDVGNNGDGCADTVPHQRETSTCPANNACTGNPWVDDNTINNIMSYYWCADLMTNDQKTRVRAAMEGTSLVNSKGFLAPVPNFVAPSAVCNTNTVLSYAAGIVSVELNGITSISSVSAIDGGNIDKSGGCTYPFEIDTSTPNTLNVGVSGNLNQLGVWIDWNDDGDFDDDAEQQYLLSGGIAANSVTSIALTYPTIIPYDDFVRIRLINDLDSGYTGPIPIDSPCFLNLYYGQSEDYAIYVMPSASTTYTYNNAWSPSDPTGVSGALDTIDVVSGDINIIANTQCNNLSIQAGASMTVDIGVTLTTTTVDLNSTSQQFSSLILNGTLTGTVNYNRYTSAVGPVGTNDLISPPVSGQTFGAFDTANPNLPASGTIRAFAPYNTTTGAFENYDTVTNASTVIGSGTGYRTATNSGNSLTFTGTVLSSNLLNVPISDDAISDAWNLVGNPYPSYLDFDAFFGLNQSEFDSASAYQAIYGYDGDVSNGWTVWNQATIDDLLETELIAPGQAFFVKSQFGGGLLDFTTTMRRTGSDDDFIMGRSANNTNLALSKLILTSPSNNANTSIYFIDGMTRGLDDGYDAGSYQGVSEEFSVFTILLEDNEGLDIAIQSLPYSDFNDVVIPLGVKAVVEGQLTIGLDPNSSLPSNVNVYLEDTQENTLTLLNTSDYIFTPTNDLIGIGRFFLRYSSETLSLNTDNNLNDLIIYTNESHKDIIIKGILTAATKTDLYDIQGRLVLSKNLEQSSITNTIDVSSISSGVYIIQVSNKNSTKTQKLIIK